MNELSHPNEANPHSEFLRLYQGIHERFARYCGSLAYGVMDTEDLVQETVLATLERFQTIREKDKLLHFMMVVAGNIVRSQARRFKFKGDYNEKAFRRLQSRVNDPETALDIHHLHVALNRLPEKDKEAVILFEILGFSMQEISDLQNAGLSATKTRISRARQKLRDLLGETVPAPRKAAVLNVISSILL